MTCILSDAMVLSMGQSACSAAVHRLAAGKEIMVSRGWVAIQGGEMDIQIHSPGETQGKQVL